VGYSLRFRLTPESFKATNMKAGFLNKWYGTRVPMSKSRKPTPRLSVKVNVQPQEPKKETGDHAEDKKTDDAPD
jgi:hypothetical protein